MHRLASPRTLAPLLILLALSSACVAFSDLDAVQPAADASNNDPNNSDNSSTNNANNANNNANNANNNANNDANNQAGPDRDGDGIPDAEDNCPDSPFPEQDDNDGDGFGDQCDEDDDNDDTDDGFDNCPLDANADQLDTDDDGMGDACDTDDDSDTVPDERDNCRTTPNTNQTDTDQDSDGDACDEDDDDDTVPDDGDNCPLLDNTDQADDDNDGDGDACDSEVIWVDAANNRPPGAGTFDDPFPTLTQAIAATSARTGPVLIRIRAGTYPEGPVTIERPDLKILGDPGTGSDARAGVRLMGRPGDTLVTITADAVLLQNLTLEGARVGVLVNAPNASTSGVLRGLIIRNLSAGTSTNRDVIGINVQRAAGYRVEGSLIEDLTGATPVANNEAFIETGGNAIGLRFESADECEVHDNIIRRLTGGAGDLPGRGFGQPGGTGGGATGILLDAFTNRCALTGNIMEELTGGPGGACQPNTPDCTPGRAQQMVGVFLYPFLNHHLDRTNLVHGEPTLVIDGETNVTLADLDLTGPVNTTTLGKVWVYDSENVTLRNLRIGNFTALTVSTSVQWFIGQPFPAAGISVLGCRACSVSDSVVSNINGGIGETSFLGGAGGASIGFLVSDCEGCTFRHNQARDVEGGLKGLSTIAAPDERNRGSTRAFSLGPRLSGELHHLLGTRIGRLGGDRAACISLDANSMGGVAANGPIAHITCNNVGNRPNSGVGVEINERHPQPIRLTNSILANVQGPCAEATTINPPDVAIGWSDLYMCADPVRVDAGFEANATDLRNVDPRFAQSDDRLHLAPGSPCIDAADPTSPYSLEPMPNGCRANLGAWGNTSSATPSSPGPCN